MKDSDLIRIGDKYLVIENIISEGGYGFIYKASEILEKDFNRLKIRSVSPIKSKGKKESGTNKLYNKFLKGFKKGKEVTEKTIKKKLGGASLKKGTSYALKKMITQSNERYVSVCGMYFLERDEVVFQLGI
jgi:hypothetical protein